MPQEYVLARLLANNAQWSEDVAAADPDFFAKSATGQAPKVSPVPPPLKARPAPPLVILALFRARSVPDGLSHWRTSAG